MTAGNLTLVQQTGPQLIDILQIWVWPIIASIITVILVYFLQKPKLVVSLIKNEPPNLNFKGKFTHLNIINKSKGFLGGGLANHCSGTIVVIIGQNEKKFLTKWELNRDPINTQYLVLPNGSVQPITTVDLVSIEEAKYTQLFPGESKNLDVAMKLDGEKFAYMHEPENFLPQNVKRRKKENELPEGKFKAQAQINCSNCKSKILNFYISNYGNKMENLSNEEYKE